MSGRDGKGLILVVGNIAHRHGVRFQQLLRIVVPLVEDCLDTGQVFPAQVFKGHGLPAIPCVKVGIIHAHSGGIIKCDDLVLRQICPLKCNALSILYNRDLGIPIARCKTGGEGIFQDAGIPGNFTQRLLCSAVHLDGSALKIRRREIEGLSLKGDSQLRRAANVLVHVVCIVAQVVLAIEFAADSLIGRLCRTVPVAAAYILIDKQKGVMNLALKHIENLASVAQLFREFFIIGHLNTFSRIPCPNPHAAKC